jgi:hypothetical protein
LITVWLSFQTAFGKSLLDHIAQLETQYATVKDQITKIESGLTTPPSVGTAAVEANFRSEGFPRYCDRPQVLFKANSEPNGVKRFENATQEQICDLKTSVTFNLCRARGDLYHWFNAWHSFTNWFLWMQADQQTALTGSRSCSLLGNSASDSAKSGDAGRTQSDPTGRDIGQVQNVASAVLVIIGSYILPMLYGFIGSAASVTREFYAKMRESLLAPRDLMLMVLRLALGVMAGACIGLFFSPSSSAAPGSASLTGGIALSASALAFLAGYGVEGLFRMLDVLIYRVFKPEDQKAPAASPAP